MPPKVSVLLTTYNRSDLLPRAIECVFDQEFDDWELIVVDDASDDGTPGVVKKFLDDERVRYIRHDENRGVAAARNTGLFAARGRYLATLDDDDVWIDSLKLRKQISILKDGANNVALVCTSVRVVTGQDEFEKIIERPTDLESRILAHNGFIYSPTVLFRRAALEEIGWFDASLDRGIDSDVYRRLIIGGFDIKVLRDVTTTIFENTSERITHMQDVSDYESEIEAVNRILEKHPDAFERHPEALAYRFFQLAYDWYSIYRLTADDDALGRSRGYALKSVRARLRPRSAGLWAFLQGLRVVPRRLEDWYERLVRTVVGL